MTFALLVAAALIARGAGLVVAVQSNDRDELLRLVDPTTGRGVGFDAYDGLTDQQGKQIVSWPWLLDMEPENVAGEISTHWLRSGSALEPFWLLPEHIGTPATVLGVLALILSTNFLVGSGPPRLRVEGASGYNARGGTPDVDALLEAELDEYGPVDARIDERLWLVWSDQTFVAALDMRGRLLTHGGSRIQVQQISPGREGAFAASLSILECEQALRESNTLRRQPTQTPAVFTLQHAITVSAAAVWSAIAAEGHLWGFQRGETSLGIDLEGTTVGSVVTGPDGRRGRVVESGWHRLTWVWVASPDTPDQNSVQLSVTEIDGGALVEVVETISADMLAKLDPSSSWQQWFDALEDWLRFPTGAPRSPAPERNRIRALWHPCDARLSELEAVAELRARDAQRGPDILVEVQLRALLCRALAAQGRLDEAQRALAEAFSGFKEAPAWVPMLEALERGRIGKQRAGRAAKADPYGDVDELWTEAAYDLARCIWIAPDQDVDLVLEAAWELATADTTGDGPGYPGLWGEFGRAVASKAPSDVTARWLRAFTEM